MQSRSTTIRRNLPFRVALLALAASALLATLPAEATAAADSPKSWALLIGVEDYKLASPLRHTLNDVHQLAHTLQDRGEVPENQILQITDDAPDARFQPLRESLMNELPKWLEQPGPDDNVLVYFSGHGFRDEAGHMYLAPIDCDPSNAAATGIPVEWFREQIAACRGKFKLMIIDSCHAGSEKGETDVKSIGAKDLAEPFRDLGDVVTLASSTGDQKSQIWEDRKQSLFTYWLNEGLKGHADENEDNQIDVDELNKYVHRNVVRTAERHFPREQTPVRIVRTGVPGSPVVLNLKPLGLKEVINDMAEQLSWGLEDHKLERVAVLEFTNDTPLGELLGANFGLVGRYCAEALEKRMIDLGEDKYSIVDRRRLQNALSEQNFGIEDLASPQALERLASQSGGLPVLALGTLRSRVGRVVNIQCKLFATETGDLIASAGGVALLNEHEWAMLGHSAKVESDTLALATPPPTVESAPARPVDETAQLVEHLDKQSTKSHPLADENFPFRVTLYVDGKPRQGVFRGNDLLVPVSKGEKYSIHVENRSGELVMMRLLVDGLNTLPQPEQAKGVTTMLMAQRVNLEDARPWVLDPAVSKVFGIRGFVSATGDEGSLREFMITDAASSVAARQQFTDQIGLITAAFYRPASATRGSLGTGLGDERREEIEERAGFKTGDLLAVLNIRYVDASEIDAAGQ